ncbi:MAG: hypothetical protein AB1746_08975 [Candidatus Zixiibacteriota bacterium]
MAGSVSASPLYKDIKIINSDDNGIDFTITITDPMKYLTPDVNSGDFFSIPVLIALPHEATAFITNSRASDAVPLSGSDGISYSSSETLAQISGTTVIRGRNIATIEVFPYYQGTFYGQITVEVEFRHRPAAVSPLDVSPVTEGKIFNRIFDYTILNYEQAGSWPIYKSRPAEKTAQDVFSLSDDW